MSDTNNRAERRRSRIRSQDASHRRRLRVARISRIVLMIAIAGLMYVLIQRLGERKAIPEGVFTLAQEEVEALRQTTLRILPDPSPPNPTAPPSSATPKPEPVLPAAMRTVTPVSPEPSEEDAARHEALLEAGLTDVRGINGVRIDMRYASDDNFMGAAMYPGDGCYLAGGTAGKLAAAQAYARQRGANLLVLDAYRPRRYQQILYDAVEDKRFVADPKNASRHNRGAAVDVTLCDDDGNPLPMPSEYDVFTEAATRDYDGAGEEDAANMTLLTEAMEYAGFSTIRSEWWHYDDADWRQYPVLDLELPAWKGKMP